MDDISISPYIVRAYVLGIGVALIDNISGVIPLFLKVFLWLTPNLCCSSVITSPKFLNFTSSCIKLCVPISKSISPVNNLFKMSFFLFLFVDEVNNSIVILYLENSSNASL